MTSLATAQSSTQATGFPTSVAQIRADRERVLSGAKAGPSLDYELLMLFVKNELLASLAMPALALVVAVALSYWAPASEILWWIGLVFISKGVLRLLCHRFKTQTPEDVDVARWRRDLAAAEFFNAMVWASVVFVTLKTDEAAPLFFIFGLTMVVVAVRMMFALTVTPVIHAGTIPLSAALVLRFLLTGDPFFWAMAAVTVGVHVCLLFLVTRMKRAVVAMMAFRAEKDALIAELEQAMAVSDEARVRAEDASAAKSKFLATMSHELRTPLNAILGFSEVMKVEMFGPMGNPTYKAYAADIHESGHHLLKLIDEVLDISRIEAGRYDLNEKPVHLPAILDDCHRLLRLRADGKGIRVVRAASQPMPRLWADEKAVRQICLNLLSNAIKFTPDGGRVTLHAGLTRGGEAYLAVSDSGPGIAESEMALVMTPFGQGELASRIGESGAGLGLPIAKGLAELHGGVLRISSQPGRGAEAAVFFPKARVMTPQIDPAAAAHARTQADRQAQSAERRETSRARAAAAEGAAGAAI